MDCRLFAYSSVASAAWDAVHGRTANQKGSPSADRKDGKVTQRH